jgi:hypothetical protein
VPYETSIDLRAMKDEDVLAADARLAELVDRRFVAGVTFAEVAVLRGEPSAPCSAIGTRLARCSTAP